MPTPPSRLIVTSATAKLTARHLNDPKLPEFWTATARYSLDERRTLEVKAAGASDIRAEAFALIELGQALLRLFPREG